MCQPWAGDVTELELDVPNIRALIRALEERFPGLGEQVEESMAVAIDGVIFQDSYLDPIPADAEVALIPRIAGG